jgi:hypothetical protein
VRFPAIYPVSNPCLTAGNSAAVQNCHAARGQLKSTICTSIVYGICSGGEHNQRRQFIQNLIFPLVVFSQIDTEIQFFSKLLVKIEVDSQMPKYLYHMQFPLERYPVKSLNSPTLPMKHKISDNDGDFFN